MSKGNNNVPVVDINIGKRSFQLVCGEGQESHLQSLALEVGEKVDMLSKSMEGANDTLLMVMSSLMLQDELNELKSKVESNNVPASEQEVDDAVAEAINAISEYVKSIASRIEDKKTA